MPKTSDTPIQPKADASEDANGATVLLEIEQLIKTHLSGIQSRKEELKKVREMLTSVLANDSTYKQHEEEAKKSAQQKSATKLQLLKLATNDALTKKSASLSSEVKEMEGALSDYLKEFQRMSGSNEIETDKGEVMEIIYVAKLVKKSSR